MTRFSLEWGTCNFFAMPIAIGWEPEDEREYASVTVHILMFFIEFAWSTE